MMSSSNQPVPTNVDQTPQLTTIPLIPPAQDRSLIAEMVTQNLRSVVRIDSQSDEEHLERNPTTPGQEVMAASLHQFFADLGLSVETNPEIGVVVTIPSNLPAEDQAPKTALMVHMDTSKGTVPANDLCEVKNWDGSSLQYPAVPALEVNAARYPHIAPLLGHTLLHGDGRAPFGLDNKNGMAELQTLAQLLVTNPAIPHGEITLAFRFDEEIGKHAAVEGLAKLLAERGIRFGWTVDGTTPFEINIANFNASRADVLIPAPPLTLPAKEIFHELSIEILGVDTHGATAKEEGYLNACVVYARLLERLGDEDANAIIPVAFDRTAGKETTGHLTMLLCGNSAEEIASTKEIVLKGLEAEIAPHRWKGADVRVLSEEAVDTSKRSFDEGALRVAAHLARVMEASTVKPLLSEESSGTDGYTNPHWVKQTDKGYVVRYRIRDFSAEGLKAREEDLKRICAESFGEVSVTPQYVDMGPSLRAVPELTTLPKLAFAPLRGTSSFDVIECPVRGGTGVDPFTSQGVYVGNLGAGYFFLESGKELTSRELLAEHTLWLLNLVQVVAKTPS